MIIWRCVPCPAAAATAGPMQVHCRTPQGIVDRFGALFFILSVLGFCSLSVLELFLAERPLFAREVLRNASAHARTLLSHLSVCAAQLATGHYRTTCYFVARTLGDFLLLRVIPPAILGGIVYYMIKVCQQRQPICRTTLYCVCSCRLIWNS